MPDLVASTFGVSDAVIPPFALTSSASLSLSVMSECCEESSNNHILSCLSEIPDRMIGADGLTKTLIENSCAAFNTPRAASSKLSLELFVTHGLFQ